MAHTYKVQPFWRKNYLILDNWAGERFKKCCKNIYPCSTVMSQIFGPCPSMQKKGVKKYVIVTVLLHTCMLDV